MTTRYTARKKLWYRATAGMNKSFNRIMGGVHRQCRALAYETLNKYRAASLDIQRGETRRAKRVLHKADLMLDNVNDCDRKWRGV